MTSVRFVLEVGSNHNQNLGRCLEFIQVASRLGCYAVKFQLFKIDKLFAPVVLENSEDHRRRKELELPLEYIPKIYDECRRLGIGFSCTPFYIEAVDILLPYVEFFKIASYELLRDDLLVACAETGRPMVVSTGMATMDEVRHAVKVCRDSGCIDLTLLHCVSAYPTPEQECNLSVIDAMRQEFGCRVGWSDHSVSMDVLHRAINRWGASMIEFHLDLPDGAGKESKVGHNWTVETIKPIIESANQILTLDGDGVKRPVPSELPDRDWRADPSDGMRPLLSKRQEWVAGERGVAVKVFR